MTTFIWTVFRSPLNRAVHAPCFIAFPRLLRLDRILLNVVELIKVIGRSNLSFWGMEGAYFMFIYLEETPF